jgi:hypothetical protein
MGHLPPNHDIGRLMASLHPRKVFLHLTERLSVNLVVLMVVLLLGGEDFLVHEEDVFMPILGMQLEETLAQCLLQLHAKNGHAFEAGVRMCPFEQWCTLVLIIPD